MNTEYIPQDFSAMMAEAKMLLLSDASAQQAIVVLTSKGNRYHCLNHSILSGDTSEEAAFAEKLRQKDDTQVRCLVCIWHDGTADMVSGHMRGLLTQIDPRNAETEILLNTDKGLRAKPLQALMPFK